MKIERYVHITRATWKSETFPEHYFSVHKKNQTRFDVAGNSVYTCIVSMCKFSHFHLGATIYEFSYFYIFCGIDCT